MIIGLDISLANTGYCLMNRDKEIIISGSIKTNKKSTQEERIKELQYALYPIISTIDITEIIIENTYLFNNPKTKQLLDRLAGVIIALANRYNKTYRFITTMTLKSHILQQPITQPKGKRGQPKLPKIDYKLIMQAKIINDYKLSSDTDNDTTDAIGLAICGVDSISDKQKVKKTKKGKTK